MVLGKSFRIYHKNDKGNIYSVLLENKNDKSETLLFESGAVGVLTTNETDSVKQLYTILQDAYGCLGVLSLSLGDGNNILYLVCITGCVSVGKIKNSEIFCITDVIFISLRNNTSDLERIQDVKKILISGTTFFSWTSNQSKFDLTLCAQKCERTQTTDNRFFWNRMLFVHLKSFDVDTEKWLLKVMCGAVSINTVYVGHQQAKACLISRLSCERAGTRFNVRGTNDNGHVANFVETEQVIFLENKVVSFIIIRGSIPLFWEQTGVQVGTHKLKMSRGCEISQPAFDRHFAMIQYLYGKQVIINLVGNKEGEHLIGTMFKAHHKSSCFKDDVSYYAFDYHYYCARGKEDNLKLLKDKIKKYFDEFSFYCSTNDGLKNYQTGSFRVNCIDCLDRTNRVQTFIGLELLGKQLAMLGLDEKATIVSRFQEVYKNMWQINGDQISRIYAGTGALEGKSKLRDGTLSVARTIQNNLLDNSKQEAIDILLTGKPLTNEYGDKTRSLLPVQYLHLPSNILIPISQRYLEYTQPNSIKVAVGTWNVNGGKHFNSIVYKRSDPLSDWLLDANKNNSHKNEKSILDLSLDSSLSEINSNSPDLFAIGFEEIVDLSAQNIVATSTTNQKEWLSELEKTLSRNEIYVCITSVQLVGVCLFLFTKPKYARYIRDVSADQVKTGLGGATGNKGGVGIRLRLYNTSICFICSHFAAGQHQFVERNSDFNEIARKMFVSIGKPLSSHDYVFWCGDFNYRIDLPIDEVKQLIKDQNWVQLLENDQLRVQQNQGKVFSKYKEGTINFAPTYKYDINSDDFDTSEKSRIPAWTDRILFRKRFPTSLQEKSGELNYGEILFYGRAELKTSDHRPIIGEYKIDVLTVDCEKRAQLFREVIQQMGPPDATVIVKESSNSNNPELKEDIIFDNIYVQEILRKLNDEIGEIILARFVDDDMRITFKNGIQALKLANMECIEILDKTFDVTLKTPNWADLIEDEINYGISNTIPLVEHSRKFNIDDMNNYDVSKVSRPNSPIETDITSNSSTILPTRPPPPQQTLRNNLNEISNGSTSNKPVRPAPPLPAHSKSAANKSLPMSFDAESFSIESNNISEFNHDDLIDNSDSEFNSSFNLPPPAIPPPFLSNDLEIENDLTFEESDQESCPPPNIPPPIIPPPCIPTQKVISSLPPKIPPRNT